MRSTRLSRRSALQLLGMGAAASLLPRPFLSRARAADIPTRIVFFYTNHGSHRPAWLPVGAGGAGSPTETAYDFGEIHQPLTMFKKDILLIDGLDMLSSDAQSANATNAHIRGHCHSLVADTMADLNLGGNVSIDQRIVQDLRKLGVTTALPSLEIGVEPNSESRISFSGASQQLPIEGNPSNTFKRLFPTGMAPGSGMAVADNSGAQQKSVLDFVAKEFGELSKKLDATDRMKLEAHADAVRDMETRLSLGSARSCSLPQLTASASKGDDAASYQAASDSFMRLIQAAFACDLTRVVTFSPEAIPDAMCGYTSNMLGTTDMHDMIHKVAMKVDSLSSNAQAVGVVKRFHTEYAKQFAKLLGFLAAIPESDGTSMLSHTIVLWCGEIAEGNHDLHQLPWLSAGQGGGIRTGRYLQVPRKPAARGHNDLYVKLANLMGSGITTFGNDDVCKGALDGLT
jgi:hypothetical protein